MDEIKTKSIEICKNLTYTINSILKVPSVINVKRIEFSTRPNIFALKRKKKEIMKKYNLTEKDLK